MTDRLSPERRKEIEERLAPDVKPIYDPTLLDRGDKIRALARLMLNAFFAAGFRGHDHELCLDGLRVTIQPSLSRQDAIVLLREIAALEVELKMVRDLADDAREEAGMQKAEVERLRAEIKRLDDLLGHARRRNSC